MHRIVVSCKEGVAAALVASLALYSLYLVLEPTISNGQAGDQFVVSLTVSDELTFVTAPNNAALSPALSGITGGTANGSSQMAVRTNNAAGYSMTITATSSAGMIGATTASTVAAFIPTTAGVPEYNITAPSNGSAFGYTVNASSSSDVDQSFLDSASTCNQGGGSPSNDQCWLNASTTAETIIDRSSPTPASGATTTIFFRAIIDANPSPAIPSDSYYATTTVTATANP